MCIQRFGQGRAFRLAHIDESCPRHITLDLGRLSLGLCLGVEGTGKLRVFFAADLCPPCAAWTLFISGHAAEFAGDMWDTQFPLVSQICPKPKQVIRLRVSVITSGSQPVLKLRWISEEAQREAIAQEFKAVLGEKAGQAAALWLGTFDIK